MFVLWSSILVRASKRIFEIIDKHGVLISIWEEKELEKNEELTSRGDVYLSRKSRRYGYG